MNELNYENFVVIMTTQRSGSNFLGSCLNSHPNITHIGPIFGSARGWGYQGRCSKFINSYERLVDCLKRIQEEYLSLPNVKMISLDIKYNWIKPALEAFLTKIKVIHLIRRDEKRLMLSHLVWSKYRKTSVPNRASWNVMYDESAKKKLFALQSNPREKFVVNEEKFERNMARVRRWKIQFAPLEDLRLYYEDLTENKEIQRLPHWASVKICKLLNLEYYPLIASTQKIVQDDIKKRLVIQ